jgi:hypothetical protein
VREGKGKVVRLSVSKEKRGEHEVDVETPRMRDQRWEEV